MLVCQQTTNKIVTSINIYFTALPFDYYIRRSRQKILSHLYFPYISNNNVDRIVGLDQFDYLDTLHFGSTAWFRITRSEESGKEMCESEKCAERNTEEVEEKWKHRNPILLLIRYHH